MTEDEARQVLKNHGWIWHIRKKSNVLYIYANRRRPKTNKFQERYIAPLAKLPELTEADIVAKLSTSQE